MVSRVRKLVFDILFNTGKHLSVNLILTNRVKLSSDDSPTLTVVPPLYGKGIVTEVDADSPAEALNTCENFFFILPPSFRLQVRFLRAGCQPSILTCLRVCTALTNTRLGNSRNRDADRCLLSVAETNQQIQPSSVCAPFFIVLPLYHTVFICQ